MTTIPTLLRNAAIRFGPKAALVSILDGPISFAELDHYADGVARGLLADGLMIGERIALWAPNMWEWVAVAVGVQRAGGVLVPLNTRLRGVEVADILARANIARLFSIGQYRDQHFPDMLRGQEPVCLHRIIVLRGNPAPLQDTEISLKDFLGMGDTVGAAELAAREAAIGPDSLADLMFTSGTTGAPKGALFNHQRSIAGGEAWIRIASMETSDRYCVFGPFSHNAGYKAGWLAALIAGYTIYWPEAYDGASILGLIADHRITVMSAPPTIWQDAIIHPNRADWNISSLRYAGTGGTIVPVQLIRQMRNKLGVPVVSVGYGMTECCGSATGTVPGDDDERIASTVGRAVAGTEIRIAGPDGATLPPGQSGEVLIRDGKLLIEYVDDPEATRQAIDTEGWLHSGDVGVLDEDGYLRITDRMKDMYIAGGFNVYPAEIERRMSELRGVHQVAVVGKPHARLTEVGHVFVVRAPEATLTEAEILEWCKANLASYKVPHGITFLDALPLNATGKVLKHELKKLC